MRIIPPRILRFMWAVVFLFCFTAAISAGGHSALATLEILVALKDGYGTSYGSVSLVAAGFAVVVVCLVASIYCALKLTEEA